MNPLLNYIQLNHETVSAFCLRTGLRQPTIWRIINGRVAPTIATLAKIEDVTNGSVTIAEMIAFHRLRKDRGQ